MTVIPWAINLYTHLIHHLRAHLLNHRRCRDNVMRFYLHCSILSDGGLSVGGLSSISSVEHMCMSVTSACVTMLTIIVIFRWWITLIGHIMYNDLRTVIMTCRTFVNWRMEVPISTDLAVCHLFIASSVWEWSASTMKLAHRSQFRL